ncbi:MAG: peptide chain release factor N(5)-glutamine methyltransferase [Oricola sp.]
MAPEAVEKLFRAAKRRFDDAGLPTPELDASLLLEYATGLTILTRITDPGRLVPVEKIRRLQECIERRLKREPVHRIIGEREFYGLPLKLNAATLVPRPDTETLVDLVLPFAEDTAARTGQCRILDLGTGTGAIALALLSTVPEARALGVDISSEALHAAESNAEALGFGDRFEALHSDWFEAVSGQYDLIVSNPPYIPDTDIAGLDVDVRDHDPRAALDGGVDGLDAYRILAERSGMFLAPGGAVAVEIGHDQNQAVTTLFEVAGFRKVGERNDYAGHVRALFFVK